MGSQEKSNEYQKGQTLWVLNNDIGYALGTVLKVNGVDSLSIRLDELDRVIEINPSQTELETTVIDKATLLATEDLTKLTDLHRPSLLDALRHRFLADRIYTYTGHILIAVNPFKSLDLYSKKLMSNYSNAKLKTDLPPHIFHVANEAFRHMTEREGRNQSILVSGESGAGKTVTTKIVLDYLTNTSDKNSESTGGSKNIICEKVLQSNPVLEAFGNAKTLRNDNSSRFGKLIQLEFSEDRFSPKLTGCKIDTYLLEKARVMNHSKGERNFHIFYELYDGLSEKERESLEMIHPEDCQLTNAHGRRVFRSDISDGEQWKKTLEAMHIVGLSNEEISVLQKIVVAIMHLGEIKFEPIEETTDDATRVAEYSMEHAIVAAKLLELPIEQLRIAFCSRIITLGSGKSVTKTHNMDQATEARNAIAMALYERMFLWLVWRINGSMNLEGSKRANIGKQVGKFAHSSTISVLDIFGFEVFTSNTFEQLFINYANEVLQQLFNEFVFKIEQDVYESEGIDWKKIEFPDNSLCISCVEHRKSGLLKMLDDECLLPKGSDSAFHAKVKKVVAKNFSVVTVDANRQTMQQLFTIFHFAGEVEYTTQSFCLKNKNELRKEQIACLRSSSNDFIRSLLPEDAAKASGAAKTSYFDEVEAEREREKRRGKKAKPNGGKPKEASTQRLQQATVGENFKVELNLAIAKIKASELHFVRCIKPNDRNVANDIDRKRTLEQLNYSGVLEAVRISRLGYSSRFLFKDFVERFFILLPGRMLPVKSSQNSAFKNQCMDILETNDMIVYNDYQIGHSKVFLKSDSFAKLESMKRIKQAKAVLIIQRVFRKCLMRMRIAAKVRERLRRKAEAEEKERKRAEAEARKKLLANAETRTVPPVPKASVVKLEDTTGKRLKTLEDDMISVVSQRKPRKNRVSKRKSRHSKAPSRNRSRNRAPAPAEAGQFGKMLADYVDELLLKAQHNELSPADAVVVIGSGSSLVYVGLTLTGVHLQTFVNLLLLLGFAATGLMFVAQAKVRSDRQKMDRYQVKRRSKNSRNSWLSNEANELSLFDLGEAATIRTKRGSFRTHRSKNSFKSEKTGKTGKSGRKKKKDRGPTTEKPQLSAAESIALNQTRRRVKSFKESMKDPPKRKFTGLKSKTKRSTVVADQDKTNKSVGKNVKKSNSRYSGVAYSFKG